MGGAVNGFFVGEADTGALDVDEVTTVVGEVVSVAFKRRDTPPKTWWLTSLLRVLFGVTSTAATKSSNSME